MFSIHARPYRLCDGVRRREILRVGGLGLAGLTLPRLLAAAQAGPASISDPTFGRAKNIIFLFLAGGPPQHETFDPKPDAPAEIRGPFKSISTNVPGIRFCELLPRTSRIADKLAIVRSMATDDDIHSSSGHWVLTGNKYVGPNARTIQSTDWPYFGSVIKRYAPSDTLPALSTVWIPDIWRLNENVTPGGQTGGLMGRQWDPDHFTGDPSAADYRVDQLQMHGMTPMQLQERMRLLAQIDRHFGNVDSVLGRASFDQLQTQAYELLTSGKARKAFAIDQEPAKVRERYGKNRWGQCVLLARRLVEAGVRLVHVQWPREPGDNAVDNPLWDTHAQNADRLEDVLCPQFDVGFSALIEDLADRGLLEETLVVAIGEFGRTPRINSKGGRDHWGSVFSCALAGGGISGGQVLGASDRHGAYPISDRVEPGHLTATMFHLLGIDPAMPFHDMLGRQRQLTERGPMIQLLGNQPATDLRTTSTGDISRVPPYDEDRRILNPDFAGLRSIAAAEGPPRPKGWRGAPEILDGPDDNRWGVKLIPTAGESGSNPVAASPHVAIGFNLGTNPAAVSWDIPAAAYIAQEVRSPFAGRYKLIVDACGEGSTRRFYEREFLTRLRCRMILFTFTKASKRVTDRRELAASEFTPPWCAADELDFTRFELEQNFVNATPGGNFSFGLGLGIAVAVESRNGERWQQSSPDAPQRASIRINAIRLEFTGKPRLNDVQV